MTAVGLHATCLSLAAQKSSSCMYRSLAANLTHTLTFKSQSHKPLHTIASQPCTPSCLTLHLTASHSSFFSPSLPSLSPSLPPRPRLYYSKPIFQYFNILKCKTPGSNPGATRERPNFQKTGLLIVLTQNHLYKPKTNPGATRERPNFQNSILAQNNIILEKRGISKLSCCGCPQLRNF